jgi:uncharacterized protein YjiS (DUF1127 family)
MIGQLLFWKSAFSRERPRAATDIGGHVAGTIRRPAILISRWLEQGAERRRLQSLDDHMLKDMGVSRCDVEREVRTGWFDV